MWQLAKAAASLRNLRQEEYERCEEPKELGARGSVVRGKVGGVNRVKLCRPRLLRDCNFCPKSNGELWKDFKQKSDTFAFQKEQAD